MAWPTGRRSRRAGCSTGWSTPVSRRDERRRPGALEALRAHDPEAQWVAALRHERLPFVSYPYEWTFSMLQGRRSPAAADHARGAGGRASRSRTRRRTTSSGAARGRSSSTSARSSARARASRGSATASSACCSSTRCCSRRTGASRSSRGSAAASRGSTRRGAGAPSRSGHASRRRPEARRAPREARAQPRRRGEGHAARAARGGLRQGADRGEPQGSGEARRRARRRRAGRPSGATTATTCSYSDEDTSAKEDFVRAAVLRRPRSLVWDLGANDGRYSRIAAEGADVHGRARRRPRRRRAPLPSARAGRLRARFFRWSATSPTRRRGSAGGARAPAARSSVGARTSCWRSRSSTT